MRYRLDEELGRGGMAVVWAGEDETLGRRVALKLLSTHLADDPGFRERFLREARIAGRLQHPNLVRVFDIVELDDGVPCIVMELVEGGTVEGRPLSLAEAAQIADGLAYAHANGVVHRDLKPSNVLCASDGTLKLADFGIARALEDTRLTLTGAVLGTLRYLSPEQAEGREPAPPADVYSLGVVLDELLAERPPAIARLLELCRDPDPARRPSAAGVAAALRGETLRSEDTGLTRVLVRPRRRVLAAAAGALAVAAVAAVAIAVSLSSSAKPARAAPIAPVSRSTDAARQAQDFAAWVRRYSAAAATTPP
jgi:eukaryotic-like serine/threonine-protein kinase